MECLRKGFYACVTKYCETLTFIDVFIPNTFLSFVYCFNHVPAPDILGVMTLSYFLKWYMYVLMICRLMVLEVGVMYVI